jgi:hypothetical protein
MKNPNIYRGLAYTSLIAAVTISAVRGDGKFSPKPPEPLPPRLGENCLNDSDGFIPNFDPAKHEVRVNERFDVALYDQEGKQASPWYDIRPGEDEICVGEDGALAITLGLVAIGKNGSHGLKPTVWQYSRDGVTITKGPVLNP